LAVNEEGGADVAEWTSIEVNLLLYDGHLVRRDPVECVVSRPAIGRVTFGELRSPRDPAPAATDKMSVVQGRRTNQCQALIALYQVGGTPMVIPSTALEYLGHDGLFSR
jgi:hypothetical protein